MIIHSPSVGMVDSDARPPCRNFTVADGYAGTGIPVFPCIASGPRAKQPLTPHGHHDATADADRIITWWTRWPRALVAIPTGPASGLWVLDVDGAAGRDSLNHLLARLGLETLADLTRVVSRTPSGGLHLIFCLQEGQRPRNRARDIGAGLDTRGVRLDGVSAGYFIAPGSVLPNGRRYELIDAASPTGAVELDKINLRDAPPGPRALLYLATFSAAEQDEIADTPNLMAAMRTAAPEDWPEILGRDRQARHAATQARTARLTNNADGMRRQALNDLQEAASSYAGLSDGRRDGLFRAVCRLAKYVAHGVISEAELRDALCAAASANGALAKHGARWAERAISRALAAGRNDALPPLARRFRSEGGRHHG